MTRIFRIKCGNAEYFWTREQIKKAGVVVAEFDMNKNFVDEYKVAYHLIAEYELKRGIDLKKEEIESLPFQGKTDKKWINCHSFYFDLNGQPAKGVYPLTTSCDFLDN